MISQSVLNRLLSTLQLAAPSATLDTYVVRLANATNTTFDEVVIFYKRRLLPGVVFLQKVGLRPGEIYDFELGICHFMESYVIGLFIGEDLVGQLPAPGDGNMTPERASQLHPSDIDPCVDVFEIYS